MSDKLRDPEPCPKCERLEQALAALEDFDRRLHWPGVYNFGDEAVKRRSEARRLTEEARK